MFTYSWKLFYIFRKRDGELYMYDFISNAGGGKLAVSLSRVRSVHTGQAGRLQWVFGLKTWCFFCCCCFVLCFLCLVDAIGSHWVELLLSMKLQEHSRLNMLSSGNQGFWIINHTWLLHLSIIWDLQVKKRILLWLIHATVFLKTLFSYLQNNLLLVNNFFF